MNALETIEKLFNGPGTSLGAADIAISLAISMIAAVIALALYQVFYEERATGAHVHRSFLLIGPAITGLFIAIQSSLPLSLGLVGALTIIRFRTPIKEPEEVGFLMLVIASSIICATQRYLLLIMLTALAVLGLVAQRYLPRFFGSRRRDGVLLLALDGSVSSETRAAIASAVERALTKPRLQSVSVSDNLTTIHYSFTGLDPAEFDKLSKSLSETRALRKMNVFYNRQGALP